MTHFISRKVSVAVAALFCVLLISCLPKSEEKGKGPSAIFTTFDVQQGGCLNNSNGVNCNHYRDKEDVYVTGGDADDGTYFFAVLLPGEQNAGFLDGAEGNLSGDHVGNRTFSVKDGVVNYGGTHKVGTDPSGRRAVQLIPFENTTNSGGVYVVAVCRSQASGPSDCKYDTFKISVPITEDTTPPVLTIFKPYDGSLVGGVIEFSALGVDVHFESMTCSAGSISLGSSDIGVIETVFDTHGVSDGVLTMACQAWDTYGNLSSAAVEVDVDNTPPEIILYTPTVGARISGVAILDGDVIDAHPGTTECSIDGNIFYSTGETVLWAQLNTLGIIDGSSNLHCDSIDKVGNRSSIDVSVVIDNMAIKVMPQSLNLSSKGKENSVTVQVNGPNVMLLTSVSGQDLKLRLPNGVDIPVNSEFGWGGSNSTLILKFDRRLLVDALGRGLANQTLTDSAAVVLTLFSGQREIGSDQIKIIP